MVEVDKSVALVNPILMTVSNVSSSGRLIIGVLLVSIGLVLLRLMPAIHERYFGQYRSSILRNVGGPIFVIVIGVLLFISGVARLF
jgi:hypothetical protein